MLYTILGASIIGKSYLHSHNSLFADIDIAGINNFPVDIQDELKHRDFNFISNIIDYLSSDYIYLISKGVLKNLLMLPKSKLCNIKTIGVTYNLTLEEMKFRKDLYKKRCKYHNNLYKERTIETYKNQNEFIKNNCESLYILPPKSFIGDNFNLEKIYNLFKYLYPEFPFTLDQFLIKN